MMIGPAGGGLASDDGAFTLSIPPGALGADTLIGVEPITSTAPLAAGQAYRLTPEGTRFAVPATVTFAFTSADLAGSSTDALSIGYQDADGRWHTMAAPTIDPVASTASVKTMHFSDWSQLLGWQLRPPEANVATFGSVMLELRYCEVETFEDPEGGDALSGLTPRCDGDGGLDPELPRLVTVNGWHVNGGAGSLGEGYVTGNGRFGTYQAPGAAPVRNPVAVSVEFNRRGNRRTQAVSNITVGGGGGWTGTISWTVTGDSQMTTELGTGTQSESHHFTGSGMVHIAAMSLASVIDTLSATYSVKHQYTTTRRDDVCHITETSQTDEITAGTFNDARYTVVAINWNPTDPMARTIGITLSTPSGILQGTSTTQASGADGYCNPVQSTDSHDVTDPLGTVGLMFTGQISTGSGGQVSSGSATLDFPDDYYPQRYTVSWDLHATP